MRVQWGTNNESITLFATGASESKHFDKLHLAIIEKQVCFMYQYKSTMAEAVNVAQNKMHAKNNEVLELKAKLKERTLWGWIKSFFSVPETCPSTKM